MCNEQAAGFHLRRVFAGAENNIVAQCESARVNRCRRSRRAVVRMNAHLAKVMPEARLHVGAGVGIEPLARRVKHVVHQALRFG
jgi:hypothetical protein